jgi:hypothetical protein
VPLFTNPTFSESVLYTVEEPAALTIPTLVPIPVVTQVLVVLAKTTETIAVSLAVAGVKVIVPSELFTLA